MLTEEVWDQDTLLLEAEPLVLDAGTSLEEITGLAPLGLSLDLLDVLDAERASFWLERIEDAWVIVGFDRNSRQLRPLKNEPAWQRISAGEGERFRGREVLVVPYTPGDEACSWECLTILLTAAGLR